MSVANLARAFYRTLAPPPKLSLSEWADTYGVLSAISAAEAGKWKTLPYQRGIMDAITDSSLDEVWVQKSARVGYTKCLNWAVAYHIHFDPCSVLLVQPTLEDAQGYSKEELAPMFEDVPVLRGLVSDAKAKDSSNTILQKIYPGGTISIVGANSPRGFRRVSRRLVAFDEIDGYPASSGEEGDPVKLGMRRAEYFWNRKILGGSTPTVKDHSRIEKAFKSGDQRRYFVPCPQCHEPQYLKFENLKWPEDNPREAYFVCEANGCLIEHKHKRWMCETADKWEREGRPGYGWVATAVSGSPKRASFHIWAAYSYSPNSTWGDIACEFLEAKSDPHLLKTFVNTVLGETWEEEYSARVNAHELAQRAEIYPDGRAPEGVLVCTAGVDVQDNRLAIQIDGWGEGEERWVLSYQEIHGDPAKDELWAQLEAVLSAPIEHANGVLLRVRSAAIDSGGHFTHEVYNFARLHRAKQWVAVRGASQRGKPIIGSPSKVDLNHKDLKLKRGATVYVVGSDTAKTTLFARMKQKEPGPRCIHFSADLTPEYFDMLTAEKQVTRYLKGHPIREWVKKDGARNEALDVSVYSFAALQLFMTRYHKPTFWKQMRDALASAPVISTNVVGEVVENKTETRQNQQASVRMDVNRKRSWVTRY